jgi:DNA polymerase-4
MAAELQKPDGLTLLTYQDIPQRLWPLPIKDLYGVGRRMEKHLQNMGFRTIGDLAQSPVDLLSHRFGVIGVQLHQFANGCDNSPVNPHSLDRVKSIGHQITLPRDYSNPNDINLVLLELAEAVCRRARIGNYTGKTVSLYVRGHDFTGLGRSRSLKNPTAFPTAVHNLACKLFKQYWPENKAVRLLGISLGNLSQMPFQQLCLFDNEKYIYEVVDHIKDRFGEMSLLRSSFLLEAGVFYNSTRQQNMGKPPRNLL